MKPNHKPRSQSHLPLVISASVILSLSAAASGVDAQGYAGTWNRCNRITSGFAPLQVASRHQILKSSDATTAMDADWFTPTPLLVSTSYEQAWRGWRNINAHPTRFIDIVSTPNASPDGYTGTGDDEVIERNNIGGAGTSWPYFVWPNNVIEHIDIEILGPTLSAPACGGAGCSLVTHTTTCTTVAITEAGTVVHELGHGYGIDHFDRWPSMMATAQPDVLNCELNTPGAETGTRSQALGPDPSSIACIGRSYGTPTGVDFGLTPITRPGFCNAASGRCYNTVQSTVTFTPGGPQHDRFPLDFTTFSNLDNHEGLVWMEVYLSQDGWVDASDTLIYFEALSEWRPGATVRRRRNIVLYASLVPAGPVWRVLVKLDPHDDVLETNENNNIADMAITVQRTL